MNLSKISELKDRDRFNGDVKILRKAKPGPVIFSVSDATGTIDAVIKDSKFETNDIVRISGKVSERAGRLQIEIEKITKSDVNFDQIIDNLSKPIRQDLSIKSERYDLMKQKMLDIAKRIRKAVIEGEPILIRHHNDSDGINSGLAIEMACKILMEKQGINPDYNLYRSPSKAPFYETGDVFRDLVLAKRLDNFGQKKPLILILDNGSTPEDVFGMKTLSLLGYEIIVIDHHNPVEMTDGKTSVCPFVKLHLNPYMFGLDGQTSAGMLCYEVARFISEDFEKPVMPATAAISDRCTIPETEDYIQNSGKSREELAKIGIAIDFVAYHMKFDGGKGIFEELLENKEMVDMINSEVNKGVETQLQSTLPYLRTQEIKGITFSTLDVEKYTLRFTYPTPGKVIGLVHDHVALGKDNAVLTLGYMSDMIIIRATKPVLPVQKIIENLRQDIPEANVDGGGHECAGTIKFVSAHLQSILENIKQQLRKLEISQDLSKE
ncbi:MAG: OB-fold nucleic acid binding domain-containing protein [Candidatus Woesearchaeota archaeon]